MLQQILDDMFIDPDVLDALNDDQKKILFLKMRQEQVRRWTEREEKLESEAVDGERKRTAPKKANRKNVSWLPGRDGDVAVIVIGERDELNSKFIHSGFGEKSLQNNACHQTILKSRTTAPVAAERENTQPGISLNLKGKREETSTALPLPVSASGHPSPPAAEKPEPKSASVTREGTGSLALHLRPASRDTKRCGRESGFCQHGTRQPGTRQPGARQPGGRHPSAHQPGAHQPGAHQPGAQMWPRQPDADHCHADTFPTRHRPGGLYADRGRPARRGASEAPGIPERERCRCIRSASEGRPGGGRVVGERGGGLRGARPGGPADENLQHRKPRRPGADAVAPSRRQAPPAQQARPLASKDHSHCQVILARRFTHPGESNEASMNNGGRPRWSLSRGPDGRRDTGRRERFTMATSLPKHSNGDP
uniref:translation initiation factor IF-2-like isoform X2 n=1 Tax=Gasterosteus aculeatus aculeatus TaxID=481459 RepID=UPI001A9988A2|nr:translation initiation factor IF-2-like isoform X2 [Gasterosteus aculeatus aculeatus]